MKKKNIYGHKFPKKYLLPSSKAVIKDKKILVQHIKLLLFHVNIDLMQICIEKKMGREKCLKMIKRLKRNCRKVKNKLLLMLQSVT